MLTKGQRVRTGCTTCNRLIRPALSRIRRVKCDEQKPSCLKCQSTGRTCDGYSSDPVSRLRASTSSKLKSSSTSNLPRTLLPMLPGDKEERRYLEYFRGNALPSFVGYYDPAFWGRFLLQVGHAEPAVRHAIVALASLHETYNGRTRYRPGSDQYCLKQYNKSLAGLNRYISTAKGMSIDIVLTCCVLFTSFESLRGDLDSAGQHLQSGLKILSKSIKDPQRSKVVHHNLLPLLVRLSVHARPIIDVDLTLDDPTTIATCLPKTFSSLSEARNTFYFIVSLVLNFCRAKALGLQNREVQSGKPAEPLLEQHLYYASLLEQWQVGFDDLHSRLSISMDGKDKNAAIFLKLYHTIVAAMLDLTLIYLECNFDLLLPQFQKIVSSAKSLIEATDATEAFFKGKFLCTDIGITAPLFYVATKCRDPFLRREAAHLILSPRRESTWHSLVASVIAKRVITIEEEGLHHVNVAQDVPESSRICSIRPSKIDVATNRVKVVFRQNTKSAGNTSTLEEWLPWCGVHDCGALHRK
ncbi:hypothetical protein MMC29_006424 [Sticta canariensis]|nr:hypothetical protein [Sticta canariensis]